MSSGHWELGGAVLTKGGTNHESLLHTTPSSAWFKEMMPRRYQAAALMIASGVREYKFFSWHPSHAWFKYFASLPHSNKRFLHWWETFDQFGLLIATWFNQGSLPKFSNVYQILRNTNNSSVLRFKQFPAATVQTENVNLTENPRNVNYLRYFWPNISQMEATEPASILPTPVIKTR